MRALGLVGLAAFVSCTPSRASLSAGQVGCRPSEITVSEETVGNDGFTLSSENWVAECNGRRFICTQINNRGFYDRGTGPNVMTNQTDVSCKEEYSGSASSTPAAPATPPPPASAPPKGGAGFELGGKAEAAQAACEAAGQTFQRPDEKTASCSGTAAQLGFPAAVTFKLCGTNVCSIELVHQPAAEWLGIIAELRNGLEVKYGPPREREGEVREECRHKEAFVPCLRSRKLRLRYLWSWPTGERIVLLIGIPPEGGEPAIRLGYSRSARAQTVDESAL